MGINPYKYEKPLAINQYDEIRINISLSLTPDVFSGPRTYQQDDEIFERS